MRLTLIHPAIGRRAGVSYMRTWQMEPLPIAVLAALTPPDVEIRFHDDRMEAIPFDEPTDLVAITVETYTAKRAYQIASEYRRRGVPVVMGGFHATLAPDEVARYAESVVVGEAENVWPRSSTTRATARLKPIYRASERPPLASVRYDRAAVPRPALPAASAWSRPAAAASFPCEFCAVQTFFERTARHRPDRRDRRRAARAEEPPQAVLLRRRQFRRRASSSRKRAGRGADAAQASAGSRR